MTGKRYVLRGGFVMTMDPEVGSLGVGDVLVSDGKIEAVAPDLGEVDAAEIDATDQIVMPGFVDTHRHTWQSLIRHMSTDWTLPQYFSGVRGVVGRIYSPEDMYIANLLGALDALDSGVTTLVDWSHNNNTPEHADAAVQALFDYGGRAVFGHGNSNDEWLPVSDVPHSHDVKRVREQWFPTDDQLVTLALAARGPQFATLEATRHDFELARELDLPVTVHVGDGLWGLDGPVRQLNEMGQLDSRITFVHCNAIADDEYDLIAGAGAAISVAPELEMHMGHGEIAALRARERDITTSISIDVCTSVGGDMFSAMRALLAGSRYLVNIELLHNREAIEKLPILATDVLDYATRQGAEAAWLGGKVGTLTPGKEADLITIRYDTLGMTPMNYHAGAVIESGNPQLVDTVMVAGRIVKRRGSLVDFDPSMVRRRAEAARDRIMTGAGVDDPGAWLPDLYLPDQD